eukprot:6167572-Pleurochrysis_carterae.AAC.3
MRACVRACRLRLSNACACRLAGMQSLTNLLSRVSSIHPFVRNHVCCPVCLRATFVLVSMHAYVCAKALVPFASHSAAPCPAARELASTCSDAVCTGCVTLHKSHP